MWKSVHCSMLIEPVEILDGYSVQFLQIHWEIEDERMVLSTCRTRVMSSITLTIGVSALALKSSALYTATRKEMRIISQLKPPNYPGTCREQFIVSHLQCTVHKHNVINCIECSITATALVLPPIQTKLWPWWCDGSCYISLPYCRYNNHS